MLLARESQPGLARGPVGAGFEAGIPPATLAALGDEQDLALDHEIAQLLAGLEVGDHGTHRHRNVDVVTAVAGAVVTAAALAVLSAIGFGNAKIGEGIHAFDGLQIHAAAESAVAAVRAPKGHEL